MLCGRRSTQARRHMKGKMSFSHGRRRMTRSCSCTARLLSTLLLGIPHAVRVRVLLSDHNGLLSLSIYQVLLCSPSSNRLPPTSTSVVRSRFTLRAIQRPKAVLTTIDDLLRPFTSPNEPTRLVHLIAFLCSLCDTLCYLRLCIVPLFSVLNLKCFAGNRDLPLLDCL